MEHIKNVELGLKENWKQFVLLVIINGFVGGMVGMERSLLPQIAEKEFAIAAKTAILSFIIAFGIVKALTNYYTGVLANRFGRKRLLVAGWIIGIPIPFILMFAPAWGWVIGANILLGINQGLTWISTVVMKIDLAVMRSWEMNSNTNSQGLADPKFIFPSTHGFIITGQKDWQQANPLPAIQATTGASG